jgi:hypothetical protein
VVAVVEADGEDARRVRERGVEAELAERQCGAGGDGGQSGGDEGECIGVAGGGEIEDGVASSSSDPGRTRPSAVEKDTSFMGPPGWGSTREG